MTMSKEQGRLPWWRAGVAAAAATAPLPSSEKLEEQKGERQYTERRSKEKDTAAPKP